MPRLLVAVLLLGWPVLAQDRPGASGGALSSEQAAFDVRHYELVVAVDPAARTIEGRLTMTAVVLAELDTVVLDLDGHLAVAGVEVEGEPVAHQHRGGRIRAALPAPVQPGEEMRVMVRYGGAPRVAPNPPWDGGFTWERAADGSPWIATSCQGQGADLWWPCKDHPSDKAETFDLWVRVPGDLFCASNGTLEGVIDHDDGTTSFHWHMAHPISNYNVALNIARYVQLTEDYRSITGETVPVFFWVLPEHRDLGRERLPEFLDHLRFFEEMLGPYPFRSAKYGVVETPHLGMEHQTCIAYGYGFRRDAKFDYDWLHHHELSHEWWANLVTCRDWKDMWLHEGFGTYMQALYVERLRGPEGYRAVMADNRRRVVSRRAIAPREPTDSAQIYFAAGGVRDSDIYYKGACVLHALRWLVGEEVFFSALRRFAYPDPAAEAVTDGSQVRFVDTEEFVALVEEISGQDLDWFFEVYVRRRGLPRLVTERSDGRLHLRWETVDDLPFPMPVPLEIGGEVRRVEVPADGASVALELGRCVVDPEGWLLKR